MKSILFISPTGTLDNGAELSIIQLMIHLQKKGYRIINVVQEGSSEFRNDYEKEMSRRGIKLYSISLAKWWWPEAPGGIINDMESATLEYQSSIIRIKEIILEEKIDLVISNTVNVFLGAIAAGLSHVPHYWLIHEFPDNEFSYYKSKIPFVLDMSDSVFTVDGNLKEVWQKYSPNRIIEGFIPFSPITSKKELSVGKANRFVSIGRINDRKNQLELLRAYKLLNRLDIELCFIGPWDEDYKRLCDDFIEKNELSNVHFLGYQSNPWEMITDKDICVFPSKTETFGLVYIEAILNGIPVIASNNLGHRTVNELFELPKLYPLENISILSEMMRDSLVEFKQLRSEAETLKMRVSTRYIPEVTYKNILNKIEENNARTNESISAIDFLLTTNTKKTKLEILGRRLSHKLTKIREKLK
ncbi:TPA: glycosyltransferase family 4 protein [Streptococcus suis]